MENLTQTFKVALTLFLFSVSIAIICCNISFNVNNSEKTQRVTIINILSNRE